MTHQWNVRAGETRESRCKTHPITHHVKDAGQGRRNRAQGLRLFYFDRKCIRSFRTPEARNGTLYRRKAGVNSFGEALQGGGSAVERVGGLNVLSSSDLDTQTHAQETVCHVANVGSAIDCSSAVPPSCKVVVTASELRPGRVNSRQCCPDTRNATCLIFHSSPEAVSQSFPVMAEPGNR